MSPYAETTKFAILKVTHSFYNQSDQIGLFLKGIDKKISKKSSPNILNTFWAILKMLLFRLNLQ